MNWQKRFFNLVFSLSLAAGVLFAQICNVVCMAGTCTNETPIVANETPASNHCHSTESPVTPEPNNDSHNCQTHDLTILLAASETKSVVSPSLDWQPLAVLPARIALVFSPQQTMRVRLSALRSPPRLPQRQILRI